MAQRDVGEAASQVTEAPSPEVAQFAAFDPPDEAMAMALGRFLTEQSPQPDRASDQRASYLAWKLTRNDVHPGFASTMMAGNPPRCVSLCTVTPKRLWTHGREVPWAEIGDTFTDAAFQRKGMFSKVVNASRERAQRAGFGIVYGMPNEQSRPGYVQKLDFAVKPDFELRRWALPVGSRAVARRVIPVSWARTRRVLDAELVARASRATVGGILSVAARLASRHFTADIATSFGPEFDVLWQRARQRLPYAHVRDARHLAWRFGANPFPFEVLSVRRKGALVGYAATLTIGSASGGHTVLVDWLFEAGRDDVALALLSFFLQQAVRRGSDAVSAVCAVSSPLTIPFARFGFKRLKVDLPMIIHKNDEGMRVLADSAAFHFTSADTDTF